MTTEDSKRDLIERARQVTEARYEGQPICQDAKLGFVDGAVWAVFEAAQTPTTPPDGWFTFGSHAPYPWIERLEFSDEVDEAGMPLWERPLPPWPGRV